VVPRKAVIGLLLGIATILSSPATAVSETMYAVSSEDISVCFDLGQIAAELSKEKHQGTPREALLQKITDSGTSVAIGEAIVNVLYSFESADPKVYGSAMGAFCIQDKLVPVEVSR
jgi:hypothetical protein